jgi:two-component system nitrate/nitrite response regulator NarL
MADLRLLVVAGDPLARAGLATLLSDQPGLQIVGQAGEGEGLISEVEVYRPDVIVWDLGWDPGDSLDMLADLAAENEGAEIAVVGLIPDGEQAPAVWSAGVGGLLYRNVTVERLCAAIQAVAQGLAAIEPELLDDLLPAGSIEEPGLTEALTPRELEVLQLLAEGLANKAIAQRLDISEHTVKFHVNALMGKLGAQSRTAAVVRATRLGLILL